MGRIRAAKPEHGVLHDSQRQIVGVDLQRQDRDVDIEEEIEVDMRDIEYARLGADIQRSDAHFRDVGATKNADR